MAQTPKSVSANLIGGTASTIYTVPSSTTAIVKTALGQNVVGSNSSFTLQKVSSGSYYPLIIGQNPQTTFATGGTTWSSQNLLNGPVTLAAGESISAYDASTANYKFPKTSTAISLSNGAGVAPKAFWYGNSVYIQVGQNTSASTSFVVRSTDATNWTEISTGNQLTNATTFYIRNISTTWVIGAWNTSSYMYSTDNGLTWTKSNLPSGKLIYALDANSSTFVFATSTGLYTSTNGSTWTANTAYSTFITNAINNNGYTPQGVYWNGTYWFISNNYGCCYTSDLTNYNPFASLGGGRGVTSYGVIWSPAYSKWFSAQSVSSTDYVVSSSNGIGWTKASLSSNVFVATNPVQVACAGSNTILLARAANNSNYLKSTNGTTWASASDVRGYTGSIYGAANGYFVVANGTTNSATSAYVTTDPTSSTGSTFALYNSQATLAGMASSGTGWVAAYYDSAGANMYCAYATTNTTVATNNAVLIGYSTGIGGVLWWAAMNMYVAWSGNGYTYYSTDGGASWTQTGYNLSGSYFAGNTVLATAGNYLVAASQSNSIAYFWYWTTDTFNTTSWAAAGPSSSNALWNTTSAYYMNQLVTNGNGTTNHGLASNGTVFAYSIAMTGGGVELFNPLLGFKYLTPTACGLGFERVNGYDIAYPGRDASNAYYGYGFMYSTDLTSSTTFNIGGLGQSTMNSFNTSPSSTPTIYNQITYFNGTYYMQFGGSNSYIFAATSLSVIWSQSANYAQISTTSIGGISTIGNSSNYMNQLSLSDGTNFIKYDGGSIANYKGTTPDSTKASSVISLGIVEIT